MANHAGAEFMLAVHHRTFQLSNEPFGEPMERLLAASASAEHRIPVREIGGEFRLDQQGLVGEDDSQANPDH